MTHELLVRGHIHHDSDFKDYLKPNEIPLGTEDYEYHIRIDNIGESPFPGGGIINATEVFSSPIEPQRELPDEKLEAIEPDQAENINISSSNPLDTGIAFLDFTIESDDDQDVELYTTVRDNYSTPRAIHSIGFHVVDRFKLMIIDEVKSLANSE